MEAQKNTDVKELIDTTKKLFSQFQSNPAEDDVFFNSLIEEFDSSINIMHQLKQFHAWCVDQHPARISNFRFRFRGWLANSTRYQQSKEFNGAPYPVTSKKKN